MFDTDDQRRELERVSGSSNRTFMLPDIDFVSEVVDQLQQSICATPIELPCCSASGTDNTSVTLQAGKYRYFVPSCGRGSFRIIVNVDSTSPTACQVFVSSKTQIPGPIHHDVADTTNTASKTLTFNQADEDIFISLRAPDTSSCEAVVSVNVDVSDALTAQDKRTTVPAQGLNFRVASRALWDPIRIPGFFDWNGVNPTPLYHLEVLC